MQASNRYQTGFGFKQLNQSHAYYIWPVSPAGALFFQDKNSAYPRGALVTPRVILDRLWQMLAGRAPRQEMHHKVMDRVIKIDKIWKPFYFLWSYCH